MKFEASMKFLVGFYFMTFLGTACTPKIVPDAIETTIDKTLSFQEIIKKPEAHLGKKILLGGEIIETHVYQEGSEIEILQKPLDSGRAPGFTDESLGRFFLSDTSFLDPVIFASGRRITVVGRVKGSKSRQIGEATRSYPLLEKEFLHLWPQETGHYRDSQSRVSFGVGAIFHD